MSTRRVRESWLVLDKTYETPTWDECYADATPTAASASASAMETEMDHFSPDEEEKDGERSLFSPSSPLDRLPPSNASLPTPATSVLPLTRDVQFRPFTPTQWRTRQAAASHPYSARDYNESRSPSSWERGCSCSFDCSERSYRPRRRTSGGYRPRSYRPRASSLEHLPVAIQPTRWYQVVGSMPCSHCRALGRHQMTFWMCQSCKVPLCLVPYRNCYVKWHGQRC